MRVREIRVAKPYAQALYDAAQEQEVLDRAVEDAHQIITLVQDSAEFDQFVRNPIISPRFKEDTFRDLLSESLHALTLNFLLLLASRQRERFLHAILKAFLELVDLKAGRIVAQVTSATPLTEAQQASLNAKLSAYSGKEVRLELSVEPSIKGGFVAQLGDTVLDASVATQLQRMKELLARG